MLRAKKYKRSLFQHSSSLLMFPPLLRKILIPAQARGGKMPTSHLCHFFYCEKNICFLIHFIIEKIYSGVCRWRQQYLHFSYPANTLKWGHFLNKVLKELPIPLKSSVLPSDIVFILQFLISYFFSHVFSPLKIRIEAVPSLQILPHLFSSPRICRQAWA